MLFLPVLISMLAFLPLSNTINCYVGSNGKVDTIQKDCGGLQYCYTSITYLRPGWTVKEFACGDERSCSKEECKPMKFYEGTTGNGTICCCKSDFCNDGSAAINATSTTTTTKAPTTTSEPPTTSPTTEVPTTIRRTIIEAPTTTDDNPASIPTILISIAAIAAIISVF